MLPKSVSLRGEGSLHEGNANIFSRVDSETSYGRRESLLRLERGIGFLFSNADSIRNAAQQRRTVPVPVAAIFHIIKFLYSFFLVNRLASVCWCGK